jgi:hypothetical protein
VVDGHGDLRSEHVLLTDPVQIVDAVEFDPGLHIADVACDLGFLAMDLEGPRCGGGGARSSTPTARPAAVQTTMRCSRSWVLPGLVRRRWRSFAAIAKRG